MKWPTKNFSTVFPKWSLAIGICISLTTPWGKWSFNLWNQRLHVSLCQEVHSALASPGFCGIKWLPMTIWHINVVWVCSASPFKCKYMQWTTKTVVWVVVVTALSLLQWTRLTSFKHAKSCTLWLYCNIINTDTQFPTGSITGSPILTSSFVVWLDATKYEWKPVNPTIDQIEKKQIMASKIVGRVKDNSI